MNLGGDRPGLSMANKKLEKKLLDAISMRYRLTPSQSLLKLKTMSQTLCSSEIKTSHMREMF